LIDAGAEDIQMHDFGIEVYCPVDKLQKVIETIKANGIGVAESGIEWIAKETTPVAPEVSEQLLTLSNALEAMDDVRAVYTNEA
jgi:transcriptional/translational regulatory protein YebC/TACO1